MAAQPAYELFSASDRLGVNYAHHGHAFTEEDWQAMMDFADKNLRGMKVERTFDHFTTETEPDATPALRPVLAPSRSTP